jgi:hypothetical protein
MATAIQARHETYEYAETYTSTHYGMFGASSHSFHYGLRRLSTRFLTEYEIGEARRAFGSSLDLRGVTIEHGSLTGDALSVGGYARTIPGTIAFPSDRTITMPWLTHELTHIWQYGHGVGMSTVLSGAIAGNYDFGGEAGLRAATAARKRFSEFNTEQQGDIVETYYERLSTGQDVSAWVPFIRQVQEPSRFVYRRPDWETTYGGTSYTGFRVPELTAQSSASGFSIEINPDGTNPNAATGVLYLGLTRQRETFPIVAPGPLAPPTLVQIQRWAAGFDITGDGLEDLFVIVTPEPSTGALRVLVMAFGLVVGAFAFPLPRPPGIYIGTLPDGRPYFRTLQSYGFGGPLYVDQNGVVVTPP